MEIRQLTTQDWQLYKQIRLESLRVNPEAFGSKYEDKIKKPDEYWKEKLNDPNNVFYVAFSEEIAVGIVRLTLDDEELPEDTAYLGSLYVNQNYRNRGIAKDLINNVERFLKDNTSKKKIQLDVKKMLEGVIELYKSLGFNIDGDDDEEIKMQKLLN